MRIIGPNGEEERWRFPGTSAFKLAMLCLLHPTYTIIVCDCDDWFSDVLVEVDKGMKVLRIKEQNHVR